MVFSRTAKELYDRWRGFQPWPGAHTLLRGKKLIVHRVRVLQPRAEAHPTLSGDVGAGGASGVLGEAGGLLIEGDSMLVICGEKTVLELVEVQLEGKKRMTAAEFLRGYQVRSGERLGL